MKTKKPIEVVEPIKVDGPTEEYFRINPKPHMTFELEKVQVRKNEVVKVESVEPTYLAIVIGNIYKDTMRKVNG